MGYRPRPVLEVVVVEDAQLQVGQVRLGAAPQAGVEGSGRLFELAVFAQFQAAPVQAVVLVQAAARLAAAA